VSTHGTAKPVVPIRVDVVEADRRCHQAGTLEESCAFNRDPMTGSVHVDIREVLVCRPDQFEESVEAHHGLAAGQNKGADPLLLHLVDDLLQARDQDLVARTDVMPFVTVLTM